MHYYRHHIGDFVRDTARLSDSQCIAYLRMMWMYYEDETPLVDDPEAIAFKIGANSSDVHQILKHFFFLHEGRWHQARCDQEIVAFRSKSDKAKDSANARWKNANAMRTHNDRNANEPVFDANHKPLTANQEKDKHIVPNGTASAKNFNPQHELESLGVDGQVASDWLKVRKAKNKPLTATALKKLVNQASIAGMEVSAVIELCCEKAWVGFSAEWVKGAGTHPSTPSDRKKWRVHPSGAIETWDNSLGMWMLSTYKTKEEAHAAMGDSL